MTVDYMNPIQWMSIENGAVTIHLMNEN